MVGDILQPTHLLFVLVVALLVLGPKRLPEVGRTLGNGIRDFRAAINGESSDKPEEIPSEPWHSEPEPDAKHEFAHDAESTPQSHEFAHDAPGVSAEPADAPVPEPAPVQPAAESSAPPATEAPASEPTATTDVATPQPATTSDTAPNPDKHEFAYESPEPAENPAGPRT